MKFATLVLVTTRLTAIVDATCSENNGCSYPACSSVDPNINANDTDNWKCVHDVSFCMSNEYFIPASNVLTAGKVCSCKNILDYPSLIGTCIINGVYSPMLREDDCVDGTWFLEEGQSDGECTENSFTACDLKCDYKMGHENEVPMDTYKGCEFPKFDWTIASISKYNSMQDHKYAIMDDTLYIGGTVVPLDPRDFGSESLEYVLSGPFDASNPNAENSVYVGDKVTNDDGVLPKMCSIAMADKETGEPKDILTLNGTGSCHINSMSTKGSNDSNVIVAGGRHSAGGVLNINTSGKCTPVSDTFGAAYTICQSGHTTVKAHNLADTAFVFLMEPNGDVRWLVQPWLTLIDTQSRALDQSIYETSVTGVSVDRNGDVYIIGYRVELGDNPIYHAMLSKHSGTDGGIYWMQEFPGMSNVRHLVHDESEGALFVTFEMLRSSQENDFFNVRCNPSSLDIQGCSLLARVSASNGSLDWTRYAYGFSGDEIYNGEVKLAHPDDGPYVYTTFSGIIGPSTLDLGSSYSGCKSENGIVTSEIDPIFDSLNFPLNPTICSSRKLGTYFSRTSEDAVPANLAKNHAQCGGYNNYSHCLVKYHKLTGLPIWGSVTPEVQGFQPLTDGIILTGSNSGPVTFDTVKVSGPEGLMNGHSMVYQSKIGLNGKGLYVQPIIANKSSTSDAGLTHDPKTGYVYLGFSTKASKTYLGAGAPVGFIQDLDLDNACIGKDISCNSVQHLTIAKLREEVKPECVDSCGDSRNTIVDGKCFIDQVCYENKDTGSRVGMPCMTCDSSISQTKWTPLECPEEFSQTQNEDSSVMSNISGDAGIGGNDNDDGGITGFTIAGITIGSILVVGVVLVVKHSFFGLPRKAQPTEIQEFFPVGGEML